jgi:hypothetical protein
MGEMGTLYWALLIVGLGTLLVQLAMSGHEEGDFDITADAETEDIDADATDHADTPDGRAEVSGSSSLFLSLRPWTFAALGFGGVGACLQGLHLTSSLVAFVAALGGGLACGFAAAWTLNVLVQNPAKQFDDARSPHDPAVREPTEDGSSGTD